MVVLAALAGVMAGVAIYAMNENDAVRTSINRSEHRRARLAAEAGIQYALTAIQTVADSPQNPVTTADDWALLGNTGADTFIVGNESFRVQILDNSGRLDLNTITEATLDNMPLTQEQIDSFLDWREAGGTAFQVENVAHGGTGAAPCLDERRVGEFLEGDALPPREVPGLRHHEHDGRAVDDARRQRVLVGGLERDDADVERAILQSLVLLDRGEFLQVQVYARPAAAEGLQRIRQRAIQRHGEKSHVQAVGFGRMLRDALHHIGVFEQARRFLAQDAAGHRERYAAAVALQQLRPDGVFQQVQ